MVQSCFGLTNAGPEGYHIIDIDHYHEQFAYSSIVLMHSTWLIYCRIAVFGNRCSVFGYKGRLIVAAVVNNEGACRRVTPPSQNMVCTNGDVSSHRKPDHKATKPMVGFLLLLLLVNIATRSPARVAKGECCSARIR